jgi:hypothetical protein
MGGLCVDLGFVKISIYLNQSATKNGSTIASNNKIGHSGVTPAELGVLRLSLSRQPGTGNACPRAKVTVAGGKSFTGNQEALVLIAARPRSDGPFRVIGKREGKKREGER